MSAEPRSQAPRTGPGAWLVNTAQRYGAIAMAFHWSMALLLIVLILMGIYMVQLPDAGFDTRKITLILYHKELGVLAMVMALARLAWRIGNAMPSLTGTLPDWQKVAARFVHLCFYGLMLALPITGWLMSSAVDIPVSFLGLVDLPDLIGHSDSRFHWFIQIHRCLGYALAVLVGVHVGAALRHHFVFRDATLDQMLPLARD